MNTQKSYTPKSKNVLSIVMPVFNDATSVAIMVRIFTAVLDVSHEIVVVYDDPNDTSAPVVERLKHKFPNLKGVLNTRGRGVLNAVRVGVAAASGRYVLIYAADEITPVLIVQQMLEMMQQGCDFISGTRYRAGGARYGGSLVEHILSSVANRLFCLLSATALSDCTTGIKMFRRELFDRLPLSLASGGWSFAFEMAIRAQLTNVKLGEVPMISVDRLFGGQPAFRLSWVVAYARLFIWGIWKLPVWHRPRPALVCPSLNSI
jgi:dolichol-phosphate mannosyltransferase